MNDDELFEYVQVRMWQKTYGINSLGKNSANLLSYCIGICSFYEHAITSNGSLPWDRVMQIGKLMHAIDSSPTATNVVIALYTLDKHLMSDQQRTNVVEGFKHVMSDYTYRKFKEIVDGKENQLARTYTLLMNLVNISVIHNILMDPKRAMDVDYILQSITKVNLELKSSTGEHDIIENLLRRFIDEINSLI